MTVQKSDKSSHIAQHICRKAYPAPSVVVCLQTWQKYSQNLLLTKLCGDQAAPDALVVVRVDDPAF